MDIQKVNIAEINIAPYNPRLDLKPGDSEYEKLKTSIENFGYVEPLVWNKQTGTLVSGHQRFKILKNRGVDEIEVSVVDLSIKKEKALNLALNKIRGSWDQDKLVQLLEELSISTEINLELTGFDLPEISKILDEYSTLKDVDDFNFEACIETIEKPITQKGDLIEIGSHRILCGDASNSEDLKKLIGENLIDLFYADPPYNVNYYGGNRPHDQARPKISRQWEKIYGDSMSQAEYETWLRLVLSNVTLYLKEGVPVYIWNGHRQFGPMHQILTELRFRVSCVITWAKENFSIGFGDYNQQTEFLLYGWRENHGTHMWFGPNNESTLWQVKRDPTKSYIHPTQKPTELAQRAIRNSSQRGGIVLDTFLGSGSTLIACENLERRCFGIEIDPRYCDAIVHRYISFVGKDNVSELVRNKYIVEFSDEQK